MPDVPGVTVAIYIGTLALLFAYGAHRLYLTALYWRCRRAYAGRAAVPLPDELPVVTVQLPLYNEMYVAERLLEAAAALDWPRDRLEIQVLDDSTDETSALCARKVAELRARGIDAHHVHRTDRRGFKAGALAAGLARARGDLVLVLDADFVPAADLLRRTVGLFADAGVGMVQVRWEHINRDFSLLTRVQALLLDGHFAIEQAVRAHTGRFFNFNGTAGVWRRAAIVDAGGWHCDTLTEDLDLSYRALLQGWRFEYLLREAAPAELPATMTAFKQQQFRWAKGSIEVARKLLPSVLRARLPWRVKVEALFHLTQNVPYLLTLVLALVAVPALGALPTAINGALAAGTLGTLAAYCATSQLAIGRSWWQAVASVPALVAITAGISVSQARAVLEGALGQRSPFLRTPKHGIGAGDDTRALRGKKYRGAKTLIPVAEVALAAYFTVAGVALGIAGAYWALPVCAAFGFGFGFVAASSAS